MSLFKVKFKVGYLLLSHVQVCHNNKAFCNLGAQELKLPFKKLFPFCFEVYECIFDTFVDMFFITLSRIFQVYRAHCLAEMAENWSSQENYTWARGYKTFFMLNSGEHEILNAHKYKRYQEIQLFSDSDKPRMLFFLHINVKMPTIVGILTFMSRKSFMLN